MADMTNYDYERVKKMSLEELIVATAEKMYALELEGKLKPTRKNGKNTDCNKCVESEAE